MTYNSNAVETQGFKFEASTDGASPLSFTEVKEVSNFRGLDGQAAEIDITHLQSAAKEFIMGLQDWGNWSLDNNYVPTDPGQTLLRNAKGSRQKIYFKATLSNGRVMSFAGYVLSLNISGGVDSKVDASFTIRITGDVTFA